ncbi:MAG: PASTA domain-containing protein [Candidatus Hydrogenedentes bacterium]|nr:PASTA domain-containing protein [Candidatus Hydrogenedentota bacterium]
MAGMAAPRRPVTDSPAEPVGKVHISRIRVVRWIFLIAFFLVGLRLVRMQLDPDLRFTQEDLTHVGQKDIPIFRGEIYDNSQRLLATDRPCSTLSADPRQISDPVGLARQIAPLLQLDESDILARLTRLDENGQKMKSVRIKRWLTDSEEEAIKPIVTEAGRGLLFEREPIRVYPEGQLAAHVIGFASRERIGTEGVELAYDGYLRGIPGLRRGRVDGKDRQFLPTGTAEYVAPRGGEQVTLTINAEIQFRLEQELDKALVSAQAPRAMGMVMDPKTGAILALACRPAFDPNEYWTATPEQRKNRSVVDVFEPGSSFKIVTASGALEHGLVTPDTMIDCENGSFNPYGHTIKDFHPKGVIPFSECFAESSNIAMIKIGAMLGPERMESWIKRFGFGQKTCPDFHGESRGIFRPRSKWSRLSMGSLPMGQELAVTMPQLARAFCVIASGGYLVEPYLVESSVSQDGMISYEHEGEAPVRILSAQTAQTMRELSHLVVLHGTGQLANIPEYRVGGKTGTAQMANPRGGYIPGKFTAIFAGFAPVADPRIVAVIVVEEPAIKLHFGGQICAPVFRDVVRESLIMMNCPQDPVQGPGPLAPKSSVVEDVAGNAGGENDADTVAPPQVAMEFLEGAPDETPQNGNQLQLTSAEPKLSYGDAGLPDFRGMTKRQAQLQAASLGLNWDAQGSGWVVEQDPPPGTLIDTVTLCRLVFSNVKSTPASTKADDTASKAPAPSATGDATSIKTTHTKSAQTGNHDTQAIAKTARM